MTTELQRRTQTTYSVMPLPARVQYATTLAGAGDMIPAGLFDKSTGKPSPAKIFLSFETGAMLGLEPMAALQGIDVIEGRATIAPRLMLALIRQAGYRVKITESGTVETGDYRVDVKAWRPEDPDDGEESSFTIQQAARAGLCQYALDPQTGLWAVKARSQRGNPLPWEMYPEDLTQWRAVSRLGRKGFGHILLGIAYAPEELEAVVGEDGTRDTTVDTEAEAAWIARIVVLDDKEDMRALFHEIQQADGWTPKVSAAFDSHLSTLTKDSKPKPGGPGHTGVPEIDGPQHPETAEDVVEGEVEPEQEAEPVPVPASRPFDASAMSEPMDPEIAAYEAKLASGEISRDDFPDAPMRADGAY